MMRPLKDGATGDIAFTHKHVINPFNNDSFNSLYIVVVFSVRSLRLSIFYDIYRI